MIQKLQKIVAKRTKEFDGAVPEMLRVTEDAKTGASEIARKQGRVEDLTRKLATQLNKNEEARAEGEGK